MNETSGYEPRYLEGLRAWSQRDYFAAHESWEALWRDTRGQDRLFYHSLIQAAVGLYHKRCHRSEAAIRLYSRGLRKALPYFPQYLGLDLVAFWNAVEAAVRQPSIDDRTLTVDLVAIASPDLIQRLGGNPTCSETGNPQ